jgi:asparagine synthase (glutamine-hydrolysing)
MREALRHRGRDDEGLEVIAGPGDAPHAILVHTRLSIVDTSPAGHQPMRDAPPHPAGRPNYVTYNGEIYNFRELRRELGALGFVTRTGTDTEVILHAYRAWGVRAVERFDGIFAFCLLDVERGLAWLCRDHVGVKPLYVRELSTGGLLFASEVRALLAAGRELVPRALNREALESFLAQGAVIGEDSIVSGVTALAPGESRVVDFAGRGTPAVRYWSATFGHGDGVRRQAADGSADAAALAEPPRNRDALVRELAAALRTTVRGQLQAEVPVGLFLSSGIDSSALAVLAREVCEEPLRTLAVGFDVPGFDETKTAEITARTLGTVHQRVELTGRDIHGSLDAVLEATDSPTVDGFNTYFISRAARMAGLTVALSGVGGDELFGGYSTFSIVPRALKLRRAAAPLGAAALERLSRSADWLAGRRVLGGRARGLRKLSRLFEQPADLTALYLLRRELFSATARRALLPQPQASDAQTGLPLALLAGLGRATPSDHALDRIAALEYAVYLRYMLLRDADVYSMVNGIELRVPLLAHPVVELAAKAPGAWRKRDPRPKPLLLDAVGPSLPSYTYRAKKRGFTLPWRAWLLGDLRERARAAAHASSWQSAGIDAEAPARLWKAFTLGDQRVSALEVLGLIVLEAYLREHALAA